MGKRRDRLRFPLEARDGAAITDETLLTVKALADAAGLAITPGLVRVDEVRAELSPQDKLELVRQTEAATFT